MMIKFVTLIFSLLISMSSYSMTLTCPQATPTNVSGFCQSFEQAAKCYCASTGLPKGMCNNMKDIYKRMISIYGSVKRACEFQKNTGTETCIDDWNCYRNGGKNADGQLCSSTGNVCE